MVIFDLLIGLEAHTGSDSGCCEACEGAPRGVLLGVLLGAAGAAGKGFAGLTLGRPESNLDEEALAMIGATLAFDFVDWGSGAGGLQLLLERGFIVSQGVAGTQLAGELLDGFADDQPADKIPDGFQAAVEEEGADDGLDRIGEDGAFAAESGAVLAAAEAEVIAEADGGGHFCHVLAADQLGAHTGQFALLPFRMEKEERFSDD